MSYDVSVITDACPTCGRGEDEYVGNYTYNCSKMLWEAARTSLGEMNGIDARLAHKILAKAIQTMRADPEKYRAMNPENGWGDYDTWLEYLAKIAAACEKAGDRGRLEVS